MKQIKSESSEKIQRFHHFAFFKRKHFGLLDFSTETPQESEFESQKDPDCTFEEDALENSEHKRINLNRAKLNAGSDFLFIFARL